MLLQLKWAAPLPGGLMKPNKSLKLAVEKLKVLTVRETTKVVGGTGTDGAGSRRQAN